MEAKADVDKAGAEGDTPVYHAARNGHADVLQVLIRAKADVAACLRVNGWSPLFVAAAAGHEAVVQRLLDHAPHLVDVPTTAEHVY